jgi:hypothetical protein
VNAYLVDTNILVRLFVGRDPLSPFPSPRMLRGERVRVRGPFLKHRCDTGDCVGLKIGTLTSVLSREPCGRGGYEPRSVGGELR